VGSLVGGKNVGSSAILHGLGMNGVAVIVVDH
jgi:hypothetical protein